MSKQPKERVHYVDPYIIDPMHPVTINVIGVGGTGSQVLNSLARMHSALNALGHPGLFVKAIDPDVVSPANMGRQLFSSVDIGESKASVLIGRINRFFGTDWESSTEKYLEGTKIKSANITISCVDSGKARESIKKQLSNSVKAYKENLRYHVRHYERPIYWMDYGNMKDRGQVVIGTLEPIKGPKESSEHVDQLPTVDFYHPEILKDKKGDDQGPSCSLAEALDKQDLFINTNLANLGLGLLWKMFRELHLKHHGLYINLDSFTTTPIKV